MIGSFDDFHAAYDVDTAPLPVRFGYLPSVRSHVKGSMEFVEIFEPPTGLVGHRARFVHLISRTISVPAMVTYPTPCRGHLRSVLPTFSCAAFG